MHAGCWLLMEKGTLPHINWIMGQLRLDRVIFPYWTQMHLLGHRAQTGCKRTRRERTIGLRRSPPDTALRRTDDDAAIQATPVPGG